MTRLREYMDVDIEVYKDGKWYVYLPGTNSLIATGRSRFWLVRILQIRRAVWRWAAKGRAK